MEIGKQCILNDLDGSLNLPVMSALLKTAITHSPSVYLRYILIHEATSKKVQAIRYKIE